MPYLVVVSEGVLTEAAEQAVFADLTDLLLGLHGLEGNAFMTPNVIGEINVIPEGRTFSGGRRENIAVVELTVPSFVLGTEDLKDRWVRGVTDIVERHADGTLPRDRIYANVKHAVDGTWGIAGVAYSNAELGAAISGTAK